MAYVPRTGHFVTLRALRIRELRCANRASPLQHLLPQEARLMSISMALLVWGGAELPFLGAVEAEAVVEGAVAVTVTVRVAIRTGPVVASQLEIFVF